MFDARQWPEGYEFPACAQCNDNTRLDELLIGWLSRLNYAPGQDISQPEAWKQWSAIRNNFPGLIETLSSDHRQLRQARDRYRQLQGRPTADLPVIDVTDPRINDAVLNFGGKLGMALYYHHSGRCLPASGGIGIRWFSNLQVESGEIPAEILRSFPGTPKLERSRQGLNDQFFYRYGLSVFGDVAIFLAFFRRSFAIFMGVAAEVTALKAPPNVPIRRPYNCQPRAE